MRCVLLAPLVLVLPPGTWPAECKRSPGGAPAWVARFIHQMGSCPEGASMSAISPRSTSPSSSAPTHVPDAEKREHLKKLLDGFDTAMLVTRSADGGMRSRPLAIAEKRDDALYFATSAGSPKVDEIEADAHVNVAMQDGRRYVSLSGVARLVRDR